MAAAATLVTVNNVRSASSGAANSCLMSHYTKQSDAYTCNVVHACMQVYTAEYHPEENAAFEKLIQRLRLVQVM